VGSSNICCSKELQEGRQVSLSAFLSEMSTVDPSVPRNVSFSCAETQNKFIEQGHTRTTTSCGMTDVFSPQAVTEGVLQSVRHGMFAKHQLGLGVLRDAFETADFDGKSLEGIKSHCSVTLLLASPPSSIRPTATLYLSSPRECRVGVSGPRRNGGSPLLRW
jgi:hypothetical protein